MFKILIAEDDRELRQLFTHVLTRHGYTVTGVSNGQEALDAMDRDFYDLIITDIMMPVMDGYELVRQLRNVEALSDTETQDLLGELDSTDL